MDQYSKDFYPPYCEGYAYITNVATMRLIDEQYRSNKVPLFWIDDLYVTGMLLDGLKQVEREKFGVSYGEHNKSGMTIIRTEKFFTWHINHVKHIHENRVPYFLDFYFVVIHSHRNGMNADYDYASTLYLLNETNFRKKESCELQLNYSLRTQVNYKPCFDTWKGIYDFYFLKFAYDMWNLL
jgi:hypothetical protein